MIISIDVEKSFDKIQHPFMIKNNSLRKPGRKGNVLNLIKITKQLMSYLVDEILCRLPLRVGTRKGSLLSLLLSIILQALTQGEEMKGIPIRNKEDLEKRTLFTDDIVYIENLKE